MGAGKVSSQSGHAFIGSFLQADPKTQAEYHSEFPHSPGTKVCLAAPSISDIEAIEAAAKAANVPHYRVVDSGCSNFFDGKPTVTALGIGPAKKNQVHHFLGNLKTLQTKHLV